MSMILGIPQYYNKKLCKQKDKKHISNKNIQKILNEIEYELKKLDIQVLRPNKILIDVCRVLWVRDITVNIDNINLMLPGLGLDRRDEYRSIMNYYNNLIILPSEKIDIEGGDILQDKNNVFVGLGKRTNKIGLNYLKQNFKSKKIIPIHHTALHLDCCFAVLYDNIVLYCRKYIKRLPSYIVNNYKCIKIEDIIGTIEPNLSTNFLIIDRTILCAKQIQFTNLHIFLRNLGYNVILISYGNLWKLDGGIRCLTQWVDKQNRAIY